MQFKHKDLLNEFNRQVQSGEYEKGWWKWEHCYTPENWFKVPIPSWASSSEYRFSKSEKHPDNTLLDVGDVVKSRYFTAVVAKIDADDNNSEKYFAVIAENTGTHGKAYSNCIGKLLDDEVGNRKHITECFENYAVIKKSER